MEKWCFTFGSDHRDSEGRTLKDCFVTVEGSFNAARNMIHTARGDKWAFQYSAEGFESQVYEYDLVERTLEEVTIND